MAKNKKQTYAALMKQLSTKKSTYEQGLDDARRMGNQSGIRDYERRLNKLSAGMDQLFGAQEQAKALAYGGGGGGEHDSDDAVITDGMMAYGGKTKYDGGGVTGGEPPMKGTKFPRDNRTPGYHKSGISLLPYDGRPGAMVENGMMAVMQTKAGPIVLKPDMWKTYSANPASFNKFIETISEDPQSLRQFEFNPETYELGSFSNGDYGSLQLNDENSEASQVAKQQNVVAAEQGGGSAATAAPLEMADNGYVTRIDPETGNQVIVTGEDFKKVGSPGGQSGYDQLMEGLGFVNPELPEGYNVETEADIRARLLSGNNGLVAPAADAPPTPTELGLPGTNLPLGETGVTEIPADATPLQGGSNWNQEAASSAPSMPSQEARDYVMAMYGDRLAGGGGAWKNDPLFSGESNAVINDKSQSFTAAETLARQRARAAAEEQARIDAMGLDAPGSNLDFSDQNFGRQRKADYSFGTNSPENALARSNRAQMIGTALGGGAQLLNTQANMKAVRNMEGPVDNPFQRVQMMNTDVQTGAAVQQIKDAEARQAAMLSGNVSNPAVRAAMMRASQRASQEKIGALTANEATQEAQMRNDNLMQINNTLNQNRMIGAQNRQRQIDFRNDQATALNRLRNQGAQQIGGMASDFMRMQADTQRLKYMREAYDPYGLGASDDERNT